MRELAENVASVKRELNGLAVVTPSANDCQEEIALALSELTQRLYKELTRTLAPAEWRRVRDVVREVTGE